ncbi:MAG: PP2C family protein-serine/threonine phosphatase [Pseudomonadota bacterium]
MTGPGVNGNPAGFARQRVLVVDDNPLNCDLLVRRLSRMGLELIDVANDGDEALDRLRAEPYDLVLLDVMMPGRDGHGVLAALREEGQLPQLPVLMVSAADEMAGVVRCIEMGAQDYLTKPINAPLLEARVRSTIERSLLRDRVAEQLERTRRDLLAARRLQLAMVPPDHHQPGEHGALRVATRLAPAREIGGDLIDHFTLGDGHYLLALGDVSGKGAEAALCMARTVSLLRALGRQHWQTLADPEQAVAAIVADTNEALCEGNDSALFVTLFVAIADLGTGRLSYACAGHPPPYLCADGAVRALAVAPGLPVGVIPGFRPAVETVDVPQGACLLAFSDGVTEAMNADGELLGHGRLEDFLSACTDLSPAGVLAAVSAGIDAFVVDAEQADDIAMLAWAASG